MNPPTAVTIKTAFDVLEKCSFCPVSQCYYTEVIRKIINQCKGRMIQSEGKKQFLFFHVNDRQRLEKRQSESMGGEEKETESKAICTFPPTALPPL